MLYKCGHTIVYVPLYFFKIDFLYLESFLWLGYVTAIFAETWKSKVDKNRKTTYNLYNSLSEYPTLQTKKKPPNALTQ